MNRITAFITVFALLFGIGAVRVSNWKEVVAAVRKIAAEENR